MMMIGVIAVLVIYGLWLLVEPEAENAQVVEEREVYQWWRKWS